MATQEQAFNFTRASTKWVWNAQGQLVEVPVDQPAYDHDPVTGEALGVLIEPSRTNNFPSNHDLASRLGYSGASGSGNTTRLNIPSTDIGIPGVSLTADSDGDVGASETNSLVSISENYALSAYIKPKTASSVGLDTTRTGSGTNSTRVVLDVSTEEVTVTSAVSGATGGAESVGGGWWRLWVVRPSIESGAGAEYFSVSATGLLAGEDIEVAGVNAEIGLNPTSYIPTTGAAVTRSADKLSRSLGAEFNPTAFSVVATAMTRIAGPGAAGAYATGPNIFALHHAFNRNLYLNRRSAGGTHNRLQLSRTDTGDDALDISANIVGPAESFPANKWVRVGVSIDTTSSVLVSGGVTIGTSGGAIGLGTLSNFEVGRGINGYVKELHLYPYTMTEQELIDLTTINEE